ncbi:type I-E CRISPR-associated protein Cas6/Cse3/CasE, partial [Streptomyces turgidiscabies]|uniref:type I-E CRISPR-associated protein Cas6/Cse3/CasE n=1 Tax=Streptomyces turgidiscabies TaxID=85558 RepID=UPI0038F66A92
PKAAWTRSIQPKINPTRLHHHRGHDPATIINPELLRQKINEGIGRGKAYGCGLLSIAPARNTIL